MFLLGGHIEGKGSVVGPVTSEAALGTEAVIEGSGTVFGPVSSAVAVATGSLIGASPTVT